MTVPSENRVKNYDGNNSTTGFSFPYIFYDNSHLQVSIDGVVKTLDGAGTYDYSVSGAGSESGGTVTFNTAPITDAAIVITRIVPYTQDTDFADFDGNPSSVTEKQFDLLVMQSQQLDQNLDLALKYSTTDTITSTVVATPVADRALVFDGTTGAVKASTYDPDEQATSAASSASSASTSASNASASASAASNSASAAAASAAALQGTSTTSVAIATGTKVFTTQSGKDFDSNFVIVSSDADNDNYMFGVGTYSGTTLSVSVVAIGGSGTFTDWTIKVCGAQGVKGDKGDTGTAGAGTGDLLAAQNLSDVNDAGASRTNLGLGALAILDTVNNAQWSGTDLEIANGGTGSSTASAAFTALKQAASESATGVVELATTAEVTTGTDTARAVTPAGVKAAIDASRQPFAGGIITLSGGTPTLSSSYGVSSITDLGVGQYRVNFSTTQANTGYTVFVLPEHRGGSTATSVHYESKTTSSVALRSTGGTGAIVDNTLNFMCVRFS